MECIDIWKLAKRTIFLLQTHSPRIVYYYITNVYRSLWAGHNLRYTVINWCESIYIYMCTCRKARVTAMSGNGTWRRRLMRTASPWWPLGTVKRSSNVKEYTYTIMRACVTLLLETHSRTYTTYTCIYTYIPTCAVVLLYFFHIKNIIIYTQQRIVLLYCQRPSSEASSTADVFFFLSFIRNKTARDTFLKRLDRYRPEPGSTIYVSCECRVRTRYYYHNSLT